MATFKCSTCRFALIGGAIALAAITRWLPHPPNFAPMTAMTLFGAAAISDRRLAVLTPFLALFVSDLGLEVLYRLDLWPRWGLYSGMWMVYCAYLPVMALGWLIRGRRTFIPIAGATFAGSLVFFLVSNFGVWMGNDYPHTADGLARCYELAIPFFGNSLLGDLCYSTVLFGGLALAERYLPLVRELPTPKLTQTASSAAAYS